MPGQRTVCSGKSGISIDHRSVNAYSRLRAPSGATALVESSPADEEAAGPAGGFGYGAKP
jgi:hypothetical protein